MGQSSVCGDEWFQTITSCFAMLLCRLSLESSWSKGGRECQLIQLLRFPMLSDDHEVHHGKFAAGCEFRITGRGNA